jgi:hypothetical protein
MEGKGMNTITVDLETWCRLVYRIKELEAANSKLHDELHAIKYEIMGREDAPGSACAVTLDDIKKEIERKLEAALPQWQPIETAPKDNTPILVPTNAHSDGIVIVRWYTYNRLAAWRDWDEDVHFPTHWMPLPQPPGE